MMEEPNHAALPSIYAARAASKAKASVVVGTIAALLSGAVFLFLLVVPSEEERDYLLLLVMAGTAALGVYRAIQGVGALRQIKRNEQG